MCCPPSLASHQDRPGIAKVGPRCDDADSSGVPSALSDGCLPSASGPRLMTASRATLPAGLLLVLLLLPDQGIAQVVAPPPPQRYRVYLHYQIDAPAATRIPAFHQL